MEDREHRARCSRRSADALKKDKARTKLLPISELGLVEMTRKRTRESLTQLLCEPCPTCDGKGHVKATATIAYEVLRRIRREAALNPTLAQIAVTVHPAVAAVPAAARGAARCRRLEATLGKKIVVKADRATCAESAVRGHRRRSRRVADARVALKRWRSAVGIVSRQIHDRRTSSGARCVAAAQRRRIHLELRRGSYAMAVPPP